MFLFQFVKHGQPPTAPQPGAAHTLGLENWVGFFALSDVDQWFCLSLLTNQIPWIKIVIIFRHGEVSATS